jgi:probable phosphoglycerate mutase
MPEKGQSKEHDRQPTHLWLMRHAPTAWNRERRVQGSVDTPLDPEALVPYLERLGAGELPQPDKIVVTGFQRSEATARGLIEFRGWPELPLVTKEGLKERKWGVFEGKTKAEILAFLLQDPELAVKYPDLETMTDLSPVLDAPGFKVMGAESMDEVAARVTPELLALRDEYPGETLLLIVHAGVLISQGMEHRVINEAEVLRENGAIQLVKISPE